jgi:hypothetical protein
MLDADMSAPDGSADSPDRVELSPCVSAADATMQTIATDARIFRVDMKRTARYQKNTASFTRRDLVDFDFRFNNDFHH